MWELFRRTLAVLPLPATGVVLWRSSEYQDIIASLEYPTDVLEVKAASAVVRYTFFFSILRNVSLQPLSVNEYERSCPKTASRIRVWDAVLLFSLAFNFC